MIITYPLYQVAILYIYTNLTDSNLCKRSKLNIKQKVL